MKGGEPPCLVLDLPPGTRPEPLERRDAHAPVLELPGPGNRTLDEEHGERLRSLVVEDPTPVSLRKDLGAPRVNEQGGVPRLQETDRRGRVGVREYRAGQVEQLLPLLVPEAPQRHAVERVREP